MLWRSVCTSTFRAAYGIGGSSTIPLHIHSDELVSAVLADIFLYASYHNFCCLVIFSYFIHYILSSFYHCRNFLMTSVLLCPEGSQVLFLQGLTRCCFQ